MGKGFGEAYLFSALAEWPSRLNDGRCLRELPEKERSLLPLVKYIDAAGALSVQVHPSFAAGKKGKDEVWFIDDVYENGEVRIGFDCDMDASEVRRCCGDGSVLSRMRRVDVAPGDVLRIPGGTIHAARGISFWEVQHSLDITYRLFDYERGRLLHLEKGLGELELRALPLRRCPERALCRDFFDGFPFYVTLWKFNGVSDWKSPSSGVIVVKEGCGICAKGEFCKNDCFWVQEGERTQWRGNGKFFLIFSKTCGNS